MSVDFVYSGKSIAGKILLYVTGVVVVTVGLTTILAARTEFNIVSSNMHRAARELADNIGRSVGDSFASLNWVYAEKLLRQSMSNKSLDLVYIKVVNPANEVYLADSPKYYSKAVDPELIREGKLNKVGSSFFGEIKHLQRVVAEEVRVGAETWHVLVAYSNAPIHSAMRKLLIRSSLLTLVIVILGALFTAILSKSITRPIIDLAKVSGRIAQGEWTTVE
ncbi:MAG: hypothetical protein ABFS19_05055, partial [Thermodesulfobacteriota bacterium]